MFLCQDHRDANKKRMAARRAAGLCTQCGAVSGPDNSRCEIHRKKHVKDGRRRDLRVKYGMTVEDFEKRLADQDGKCAICRDKLESIPHVDHDHATERVRDILCRSCNLALGFFRDSPDHLMAAINYLRPGLGAGFWG
jgi:hypothetical protein